MGLPAFLLGLALLASRALASEPSTSLPSYHYGAPLKIECMNRSS